MTADGGLDRATRIEAMLEIVGDVSGKQVIDIGCGEGQVAQALAERGAHVLGFDPFIPGTDEIAVGEGSYRLQVGSADALPVGDGIADVVLFMFSLHHVPGAMMPRALVEARRVLRPGGQLCVVAPTAPLNM
jgi:ubiquinone/menaquinone biosynthesis C-methylase UbiE